MAKKDEAQKAQQRPEAKESSGGGSGVKMRTVVDTRYKNADGEPDYAFGNREIEVDFAQSVELYAGGRATYVEDEDEQRAKEDIAGSSDDESFSTSEANAKGGYYRPPEGLKGNDANASNLMPAGSDDDQDEGLVAEGADKPLSDVPDAPGRGRRPAPTINGVVPPKGD